jgi:hypothetical protein
MPDPSTASVLHYVSTNDYEPQDDAPAGQIWADYIVSGGPSVRAIITPEDGTEVVGFDRWGAIWFKASFDGNTPAGIVVATLQAAETWALGKAGAGGK